MKRFICYVFTIVFLFANHALADYYKDDIEEYLANPNLTLKDLQSIRQLVDSAINDKIKSDKAYSNSTIVFFPLSIPHNQVDIKPAEDRNTFYMKDYTGMNLAAVGTIENGICYDTYGDGRLKIEIVESTGKYIFNKYAANYVVIGQNHAANTPLRYTRDEDSGEIINQNYESILIFVQLISQTPTEIQIDSVILPSEEYKMIVDKWVGAIEKVIDAQKAMNRNPTNTKLIQAYMDSVKEYNKAASVLDSVDSSQLAKKDLEYYKKAAKKYASFLKQFE